jgi:hypothetical protein
VPAARASGSHGGARESAAAILVSDNAIAQLLMMPAYPFWSLCIFAIDILAIYGLIAHGKRIAES